MKSGLRPGEGEKGVREKWIECAERDGKHGGFTRKGEDGGGMKTTGGEGRGGEDSVFSTLPALCLSIELVYLTFV